MTANGFYGGKDPRDLPLYTIGEGARYLQMAQATLRSWVKGRTYPVSDGKARSNPIISAADPVENRISFNNLVEAHVLRALRTRHDVSMANVRSAIRYAERQLKVKRLLISADLQTSAGDIFLEKYGSLINLSKSGQLALKRILEAYLERIERDEHELPLRLYPFVYGHVGNGAKTIVIDPLVSFGRPTISQGGISTSAIVARIDAGETVEELADDYSLAESEVEAAIVYEQAA